MIAVAHLYKSYGSSLVVNDVSFGVAAGETLVLLGTSGSGKTTTLRMINRLAEPDSGLITIGGRNIADEPPERLRRKIGYVLQGYGLFPHYTVAQNIAIVPQLLQWSKDKIQQRVAELLHKLQLPPETYGHLYPGNLSGGQKQRVGLARALAADPPILLMDEPFGALDPLTRGAVRQEFKALDELKKKTIILVTHDVQEAFELGNRIALMDKGKLVQLGTPLQLLLKPANAFVEQFFAQQRLQLEWQAIALQDIWDQLPMTHAAREADINSRETLWTTMQLLVNKGADLVVYDKDSQTRKTISFAHLPRAIQYLKQHT